jgi:hypothetical protein
VIRTVLEKGGVLSGSLEQAGEQGLHEALLEHLQHLAD